MSFFRSVLIASFISLLAAVGLLLLGFSMGYEEFRGGYAVLTVDAAIEDRALVSILETAIFLGAEPISESSQWVMLDVFDSLQKIPLDIYASRVYSFDPRNDGYADRLREVFVRDGKRFVYIPLMAGNWNSSLLDRKFNELLIDIPFSVNYYGIGRPLALFFIVYAIASIVLLVMCYLKRKTHRNIVNIIPMVPVISSLGFFGAAGLGSAALLFGLFILLKEPLADLVNPSGLPEKGFRQKLNKFYKEIIYPYRNYWYFLPVFFIAFAILIVFSQLKPLFLLALSLVSFAVFFFSLKIVSFSGIDHKRFNPVTIMRRRFPEFVFPLYILPFVAGTFITMFFTPFLSGSFDSRYKFDVIIDEQEYYDHLMFQAAFSTRQMSTLSSAFPSFHFDADGLPIMDTGSVNQSIRISDFPAFPLKHLMEFFNNVNSGNRTDAGEGEGAAAEANASSISERLSLLVLLLFLFPGLIVGKKDNNPNKYLDGLKRFSGKLRLIGINWNNKLVYNGRNLFRRRKDA
jgi:hypothetical protein